jgi:hypothetical protein
LAIALHLVGKWKNCLSEVIRLPVRCNDMSGERSEELQLKHERPPLTPPRNRCRVRVLQESQAFARENRERRAGQRRCNRIRLRAKQSADETVG